MGSQSRWAYTNAKGTADYAVADALPTLAGLYASMDDILTAANAAGARACLIENTVAVDDREIRYSLSAALVGAEDTDATEDLYLVSWSGLDGSDGLLVEHVGTTTWTASTTAIPSAQGGRANHKFAKTAAFASTGLVESRTGKAANPVSVIPAMLEVFDTGPYAALLRVFRKGTATSVAPIDRRWR